MTVYVILIYVQLADSAHVYQRPTLEKDDESNVAILTAPLPFLRTEHPQSPARCTLKNPSLHQLEGAYIITVEEAEFVPAEFSSWTPLNRHFPQRAFIGGMPSEQEIRRFLQVCPLYDCAEQRWTAVPREVARESVLCVPFCEIIQAVIDYFGYSNTRTVINNLDAKIDRPEGGRDSDSPSRMLLESLPCIFRNGCGSDYPRQPFKVYYYRQATASHRGIYLHSARSAKLKICAAGDVHADLTQIAIYARQHFIQQHGRKAVYSIMITEKSAVPYITSRSGVSRSVDVGIHQNAARFVQFILQVTSAHDIVRFDRGIFWNGEDRFLEAADAEGNGVIYQIVKPYSVSCLHTVCSRTTVCWKASNPKICEAVLINDASQVTLRRSETELLGEAKKLELAEVVQMVAYQADEKDIISSISGADVEHLSPDITTLRDRTYTRIIFFDGGKPLEDFSSRGEVLYTLRDAIAGHQSLWNAGVLHRNVSLLNILIGHPDAPTGHRGVIIDLDLSIWTIRKGCCSGFDSRMVRVGLSQSRFLALLMPLCKGIRAFQSVNVLNSYDNEARMYTPHDYFDDLESFFYVFCWLCFGYEAPMKRLEPFPKILSNWEEKDPVHAAAAKIQSLYFIPPRADKLVTDYFGPVFRSLFTNLLSLFKGPQAMRKRGDMTSHAPDPWPTLEELRCNAQPYQIILGFFDEAIAEYAKEEGTDKLNAPAHDVPLMTPSGFSAGTFAIYGSPHSSIFAQSSQSNLLKDRSPTQRPSHGQCPASLSKRRRVESDDEDNPNPKKPRNFYKPLLLVSTRSPMEG